MSSYNQRKETEHRLLAKYADVSVDSPKQVIISSIKRCLIKHFPLTNYEENNWMFGDNLLKYTYFRCHHNYSIKNITKLMNTSNTKYPCLSQTMFTNSGMTAISLVIDSLLDTKKVRISYNDDIYYETIELLTTRNNEGLYHFRYIDAIEPNFELRMIEHFLDSSDIDGIVFDTTCLGNENISLLLDKAVINKKFVVLVKSLTKLDMLGTEYSSMGMLCVAAPLNLSNDKTNLLNEITQNLKVRDSLYNCCPEPMDFPPFWQDDIFFELNELRLKYIRDNTAYLYRILSNAKSPYYKVIKPNHSLFLLIIPFKNIDIEDALTLCKHVEEKLGEQYNIKICDSFGFDHIGIDPYLSKKDGLITIRLSLNDYDKGTIQKFGVDLISVVTHLIES